METITQHETLRTRMLHATFERRTIHQNINETSRSGRQELSEDIHKRFATTNRFERMFVDCAAFFGEREGKKFHAFACAKIFFSRLLQFCGVFRDCRSQIFRSSFAIKIFKAAKKERIIFKVNFNHQVSWRVNWPQLIRWKLDEVNQATRHAEAWQKRVDDVKEFPKWNIRPQIFHILIMWRME